MFSLQGMAAVIMGALLFFMPESPRFLLAHSRPDEAREVLSALADIPKNDPVITEQMEEIVRAIETERASARNWGDLMKRGKNAQGEKRRMFTVSIVTWKIFLLADDRLQAVVIQVGEMHMKTFDRGWIILHSGLSSVQWQYCHLIVNLNDFPHSSQKSWFNTPSYVTTIL